MHSGVTAVVAPKRCCTSPWRGAGMSTARRPAARLRPWSSRRDTGIGGFDGEW